MPSEVDPRLVRLLKASLGLVDALRDAGVAGGIAVSLGRDDGLSVLQLVSGSKDPCAEAWSQRHRPVTHGTNSLGVAGLAFTWPKHGGPKMDPVNDNHADAARYSLEEDTPALR